MDSTARLLAVVSLLKNAHGPVSLTRIQAALAPEGGYTAKDQAAVRRMFERDKKALREAGYELEWHAHEEGYTLGAGSQPLELSQDETDLLITAADLAGAGALRSDVRAAVERILAVGNTMEDQTHLYAAWHPSRESHALDQPVDRLLQACRRRLLATFTYTDERGEPSTRNVEPWGLCSRRGVWFLIGFCHLRNGKRTFRVARMLDLKVEGLPDGPPKFVVPDDFDVRVEADLPAWDWSRHPPAELHLRVGVGLARNVALRLGGDARVEGDEVRRTVTNAGGVDEIVTELYPRVTVLGPPWAVATWDAHRERLRASLRSPS